MKKLLIIGGSGLLGNQLIYDFYKTYYIETTYNKNKINPKYHIRSANVDVTKKSDVDRLINSNKWDFVIHAASIGDVDYCERNKKITWEINVTGTKIITQACKRNNIPLIFFSTNAVYDGKYGSYSERDKPKPINHYGKTKLAGELIVNKLPLSIILRLNTMYGWNPPGQRQNPATWIISNLRNNKAINVVVDVFNSHLWVGYVSQVVGRIILNWPDEKIINVGGKECVSRYQFALMVAKVFKLNPNLIKKALSSNFPAIAPRPKNTCFVTSKMESVLKIKPQSLKVGLNKMKSVSLNES